MADSKIFAGPRVRRIRTGLALTQTAMAEALASRVRASSGDSLESQIGEAFRLGFQRQPDPEEMRRSTGAVNEL